MTLDPTATANDLHTLRDILAQFFGGLRADDWNRKTGTRDKDWTLAQTVAHVASVAAVLNNTVAAALVGEPTAIPGMARREDLAAWNAAQIAALLAAHSAAALVAQVDAELARAADLAGALTAAQAQRAIPFAFYNRPAPLGNLIAWQLSHAGVIHGAQLPRAVDQAPLWERHDDAMRQRQLARFLLHFSWAYWHTHAPDVSAVLHIHVAGAGGGDWTLLAAPDGGDITGGAPASAMYTYHFASADVFFSLFTVNETFPNAQAHGEFRVTGGDPAAAVGLLRYFAASPPS